MLFKKLFCLKLIADLSLSPTLADPPQNKKNCTRKSLHHRMLFDKPPGQETKYVFFFGLTSREVWNDLAKEAKKMMQVRDDCVLDIYGICKKGSQVYGLILPFMRQGSLHRLVKEDLCQYHSNILEKSAIESS